MLIFFKKIQNSDEKSKKRWLVILSGISIIIVITAWAYYMNAFVLKNPNEAASQEIEVGFWPVFKTGMAVTAGNIKIKAKNFIMDIISKIPKIGGEKKITIENPR